jgi:hypothetical protein
LTPIATFPSDYSGNETNRWTAATIYFDYDNSHRNYDTGVRPADEIHLHVLDFQHKAETDNVKTHSGIDRQEGQQRDASSTATTDLQRKSNTNTETHTSVEDDSKIDANVNYNSNATAKAVSSDDILRLYNARFRKLVPLSADSKKANVYDHLITDEEIKTFPSAEGKPVRFIHENPDFWTEKRLQDKAYLFYNVATTFGPTDLKDSKGRLLNLYGGDVDTREAYEALKDLIEILKGITFVVKTHKEYGYHFYILSPVFHEAMGRSSFKPGAEIEIKTDLSLGLMHLPPSRHRRYPYWNYKGVSTAEHIYVDEDDKVFQEIIKRMSPYLRKEPTEENILTLDAYPSHLSGSNVGMLGLQKQPQRPQPNRTLTAEQNEKIIDIILNTSKTYVEYARNDFIYGLSGHLFHNEISEFSASSLIGRLCKQANDEEADARLDVVSETYKKGNTGKPIRGISQLRYLLAKYNDESEVRANEIIAELNQALGIAIDTAVSSSSSGSTLGRNDPAAEAILQLSESNGDIFFKDTFGQPCALINMTTHVEVVSMDGKRFESHLRRLLKRDLNKRIISKDSLEKAIESLKSDAVVEGRTIPLHLRVAWKKKNEIIYYDPTDDNWSCIAIGRDIGSWQLLPTGSLTGYPIAELRNPNSKLTDQPVLFTRYSQVSQVMPDGSYPPDIMQQFIDSVPT